MKKIRKNKVALFTCLLASFFLLPPVASAAETSFPYVGLTIGLDNGHWDLSDTMQKQNFDANGMYGGAVLGFGGLLAKHFWLAGEASGAFTSGRSATRQINTVNGDSTARLRMRYTYGLSLIPGVVFQPVMIYARIGAERSRFDLTQSVTPSDATSSTSYNQVGASVLGLGVQFMLPDNFNLRGEYNRLVYRSFTAFGNRIRPTDDRFSLGLLYALK